MYQAFGATRGTIRPTSGAGGPYQSRYAPRHDVDPADARAIRERKEAEFKARQAERAEKETKKAYAKEKFVSRFPPSQRAFAEEKFEHLGRFPPEQREMEGRKFDVQYKERMERATQVAAKPAEPPAEHKQPETQPAVMPVAAAEAAVAVAVAPPEKLDDDTREFMAALGLARLTQSQLASKYDELKVEIETLRKAQAAHEQDVKYKVPYKERSELSKSYNYKAFKETEKRLKQSAKAKEREAAKEAKAKAKAEMPKRKPGRPKKVKEEAPKVEAPVEEPKPKRKPGRPKKVLTPEEEEAKRLERNKKAREAREKKKAEKDK